MTSLRTAPEQVSAEPLQKRALSRVVIEGVEPEVDGGRFPIKRTVGEEVAVSADIFADGPEHHIRRRANERHREVHRQPGVDGRR